MNVENRKASGWDVIGGQFWRLGRTSARPSMKDVSLYLDGVVSQSRVCVIGASTVDLIQASVNCGASVTVLDFSEVMCHDAREAITGPAEMLCMDITVQENRFAACFDAILCDRLVNRFTEAEAIAALRNIKHMLAGRGMIRCGVKIGLYEMDRRMIAAGAKAGRLHEFFDEATATIDFAAAGAILEECVVPHGSIPHNALLDWYKARGKEKRFAESDFPLLVARQDVGLRVASQLWLPDAPSTIMYELVAD